MIEQLVLDCGGSILHRGPRRTAESRRGVPKLPSSQVVRASSFELLPSAVSGFFVFLGWDVVLVVPSVTLM
jgi:hypothetical protein